VADPRVTEDMVTRAAEVLAEVGVQDRDLVRRVLDAAVLGIGSSVVVTEHAYRMSDGDWQLWDPQPHIEAVYPLAKRIEAERRHGARVFRRTAIVVDDWAEVTEP
jgi:hypothetical protein